MVSLGKSLALLLVLLFIISSVIMSRNVRADSSTISLSCNGNTESTLTFSWTASDDQFFAKYTLYESSFDLHTVEGSSGPYNEVWSTTSIAVTTTTIIVTNIGRLLDKDSISHYFYILESSSLGNSSKSNIIIASPTSPPNPNLYIASQTPNAVTIKWADFNNYCAQAPFNSYTLQVNPSGENGTWSTVQTITDSSIRSYTLTGLSAVQYRIRIYDTVGVAGNIQTSYSNVAVTALDSNANGTPSNSSDLNLTPTPAVPEVTSLTTIVPLLIAILSVALLIRVRSRNFD